MNPFKSSLVYCSIIIFSVIQAQGADVIVPQATPKHKPGVAVLRILMFVATTQPDTQSADPNEVWRKEVQTRIHQLLSRNILAGALHDKEVQQLQWFKSMNGKEADPVKWLERHVHARAVPDESLIEVFVDSMDSQKEAALLVNKICGYYVDWTEQQYRQKVEKELAKLNDELRQCQSKIREISRSIATRSESGSLNPAQQMALDADKETEKDYEEQLRLIRNRMEEADSQNPINRVIVYLEFKAPSPDH